MDLTSRAREDVTRIQHVALEVPAAEVERAATFWGLAGFERVEPPASLRQRSVWLEAGPAGARTQIHLLIAEAGAQPPGDSDAAQLEGSHVAIVIPAFGAIVASLAAAGFAVEERQRHWGAERAFAAHPGGHTVELMAAPPPAT